MRYRLQVQAVLISDPQPGDPPPFPLYPTRRLSLTFVDRDQADDALRHIARSLFDLLEAHPLGELGAS